jgi:transcriptional regulator
VIFQGPHAYISPTWYKTKPAVPTWNYAVVHAYGIPHKISQDELSQDLSRMIEFYEGKAAKEPTYPVTKAYQNELLSYIVGFRMVMNRVEAKFKLGQNRSLDDQKGMLEGLRETGTPEALSLVSFIQSQKKWFS